MVVHSKYSATGNKHLANKCRLALNRNSKKVFPGSTTSDLFFLYLHLFYFVNVMILGVRLILMPQLHR